MSLDCNTPIHLQITFNDESDLDADLHALTQSEQFMNLLKTELLPRVKQAVTEGLESFTVFRMVDYETDLFLDRDQYYNLLDRFTEIYLETEDYVTCEELQKLKKKV